MPDIELERLRQLRRRAEALLATLVSDLRPFRHSDVPNGFLRTPDSESISGDVNVTTTCSCLMALALTDKLGDFYADDGPQAAGNVFETLLKAPWMSSGLAENNAFTTTLVLRTFGFLVKSSAVSRTLARTPDAKAWEPQLDIRKLRPLARKLAKRLDPRSRFLFDLMPNGIQADIETFLSSGTNEARIRRIVAREVGRIVRTTALYDPARFKGLTLARRTREAMKHSVNAYSTAHVNRLLLDDSYPSEITALKARSLQQIAKAISADPERFGINEYASAAAVVYWFVDGIDRATLALPKGNWKTLCNWATSEFTRQRSLVVAKHAAMMDPIAMAMAACLCARLRSISNRTALGTTSAHQAILPSTIELEQSILELFTEQTDSGIWPKYFPLFHYQEAGSNFCFTFELLEAVLTEFGDKHNRLINQSSFVEGLELAVTWCERNRLQYSKYGGGDFRGWNSGGFLNTLRKDQPESWATAVVHMFLWELVDVLSRYVQDRLLDKYAATSPTAQSPRLHNLLDIDLWINKERTSLKETMLSTVIKSFRDTTARTLRTHPPEAARLSALLFGPPGTSKTQLAKAIAAELGWPLVEIDPSHFLQSSFQNIYIQADKIFQDIIDMSGVVVLFDEMDALVQKRNTEQVAIDTESKFLTTYMLPKLAALHDRGRVVFFMATNFQDNFDDAIKRAGRFDLLLCMGPPTLAEKCRAIHVFYGVREKSTPQTKQAGKSILAFCKSDSWLQQQLELYTFGEFKNLLVAIADKAIIGTTIEQLGPMEFVARVRKDSGTVSLRFSEAEQLLQQHGVKRLEDLGDVEIDPKLLSKSAVLRYIRDRTQSKLQ